MQQGNDMHQDKPDYQRCQYTITISTEINDPELAQKFKEACLQHDNSTKAQVWCFLQGSSEIYSYINLQKKIRISHELFSTFISKTSYTDYTICPFDPKSSSYLDAIVNHGDPSTLFQEGIDVNSKSKNKNNKRKFADSGLTVSIGNSCDSSIRKQVADLIREEKVKDKEEVIKKLGNETIFLSKTIDEAIKTQDVFDKRERRRTLKFVAPEPVNTWGVGWNIAMNWAKKFVGADKDSVAYNTKRKHLWLWGPPNTSKTKGFLNPLIDQLHCYQITKDEKLLPYDSEGYDLMYCDEFNKPFHALGRLNELTQLNPGGYDIRVLYGRSMKYDNPPCLFISQMSIDEVFRKNIDGPELEAFKSRFFHIMVDQQGNPFNVKFDMTKEEKELEDWIMAPARESEIEEAGKEEQMMNMVNSSSGQYGGSSTFEWKQCPSKRRKGNGILIPVATESIEMKVD